MAELTREQIAERLRDRSTWAEGWQTRGGRLVRIYADDGESPFPIHGALKADGGWRNTCWTRDGKVFNENTDPADLIPRPQRIQGWAVVCQEDGCYYLLSTVYESPEVARPWAAGGPNTVAIVRIDCAEGEGLDGPA